MLGLVKVYASACADDDDDQTIARKAAEIMSTEILCVFDDADQEQARVAVQAIVPDTMERYVIQFMPSYIATMTTFIDAYVAIGLANPK